MKSLLFLTLFFASINAASACLSSLTTSKVVTSKIRGLYINKEHNGEPQAHYVILDKATCTATPSGDATLAPLTKSYHYLSFSSTDQNLYASLMLAQAQDISVDFRLTNPKEDATVNAIAYIISPAGAATQ